MDKPFAQVFPAPAKINRFLHITGRRADGYHELQTVFQFLDLEDRLRFEPRPGGEVAMASADAVDGAENLCVRAARMVFAAAGRPEGVTIHLDKRLPVGGGVGGGSSDAATTLVALNYLFELGLDESTLADLGLRLGADVPVFVRGRAAWAEGVGETLVPVRPDCPWALLIDPGVPVATGTMFGSGELTRDCPTERISHAVDGAPFGNVFEPVVRTRHPDIARALDWLGSQTDRVRLSGTGGCVFGLFRDRAEAERAREEQPLPWSSRVTRLRNESPLRAWLPESGGHSTGP
ncbi:4-(cytidine 5'-diphospho)-2-C-methyl-D-erythritol kinase [Thioalkalivibrio sp. AKL17]|uniref:4-(cytidine 5'-diphospho)-2-C-methyl-D-erythritol kinase n=1 Tax=Thioalkalivibrio sp. AKL17 TaxID=1158160 RepID=UPI00039D9106|nr:4-(cytidine 5'-diphospho)-2-C-methyl-D-erythritol kinase [Thioalkalivibrio sp. AKL17]